MLRIVTRVESGKTGQIRLDRLTRSTQPTCSWTRLFQLKHKIRWVFFCPDFSFALCSLLHSLESLDSILPQSLKPQRLVLDFVAHRPQPSSHHRRCISSPTAVTTSSTRRCCSLPPRRHILITFFVAILWQSIKGNLDSQSLFPSFFVDLLAIFQAIL